MTMREILYRRLNSNDRRKQDFVLRERVNQGGTITQVEKHYTYAVVRQIPWHGPVSHQPASADGQAVRLEGQGPRYIFVRKLQNSKTGREYFTYKILGHFSVVLPPNRYQVAYRHTLTMEVQQD